MILCSVQSYCPNPSLDTCFSFGHQEPDWLLTWFKRRRKGATTLSFFICQQISVPKNLSITMFLFAISLQSQITQCQVIWSPYQFCLTFVCLMEFQHHFCWPPLTKGHLISFSTSHPKDERISCKALCSLFGDLFYRNTLGLFLWPQCEHLSLLCSFLINHFPDNFLFFIHYNHSC